MKTTTVTRMNTHVGVGGMSGVHVCTSRWIDREVDETLVPMYASA